MVFDRAHCGRVVRRGKGKKKRRSYESKSGNDNMVKRKRVHRWMPRSREAKKAVVSCEKPGGGAHILRFLDSRMG